MAPWSISIMVLHMISLSVTYELKLRHVIKNSFLLTIGLLPQSMLIAVGALIPLWLIKIGGVFSIIGYIMLIFIGLSVALLMWTDFCQWAYDRFVNDRVEGAQKNRGIYEKVKEVEARAQMQYASSKPIRSSLNDKPIKPITDEELRLCDLPSSFNRGDIEKLNESRRILYEDHERYVEEHKNDPEFMPTEEEKELQKEQEAREKRIEQAKKELAKRNKRK